VNFTGCQTAILIAHGFDFVFQDIQFKSCNIGINGTAAGAENFGSYVLLDSIADTVDTLIMTKSQQTSSTPAGDSIVIDNLEVVNVGKHP